MAEELAEGFPEREKLTTEVIDACLYTGLILATAAPWIGEIISRSHDRGWTDAERKVRAKGEAIDELCRRALKAPTNMKLGSIYVAALTLAGRERPGEAALLVVHRVMHIRRVRRQLQEWRSMELPCENVIFIPAKDRRTCAAAFEAARETYSIFSAQELPLPACDSDFCRCVYSIIGLSGANG